ncbi:MAG TPA: PRC-barrel domain-containing protein [Candidatus Saccharimonadales bacterium]|nr:PRC-barrel domain-containing protein [Candidatus Saccharimonadales bacterium]
MLRSIKKFVGHKLGAKDGHIGHVKDIYFDDQDWAVRYIVADTGAWLPGRLVLLAPHALGPWNAQEKLLPIHLTRHQIENSPPADLHKPVSRQYEEEYYRYYNWPFYWQGGALWGVSDFPMAPLVNMPPVSPPPGKRRRGTNADAHLRSAETLMGYQIQGSGQEAFGHVADFLMDDETWGIDHVVLDMGSWLSGKKVLLSPFEIEKISWSDSKVFIDSTKSALEKAPAYESSAA